MNVEQKKDVLISLLEERYFTFKASEHPNVRKSLDRFYDLVRDLTDVNRCAEMLEMIYSSDYDEIRDYKELASQIKKDRKGLEEMFIVDLRKKMLVDKEILEIMYCTFEEFNDEFLNGTIGDREIARAQFQNGF